MSTSTSNQNSNSIHPDNFIHLNSNLQNSQSSNQKFINLIQAPPTTPSHLNNNNNNNNNLTFAIVSSKRSLGTPTSDLRATSPSSNLNYQSNDDQSDSNQIIQSNSNHLNPSAEWSSNHHIHLFHHLNQPTSHRNNVLSLQSDSFCFWAILNQSLKFVYIDPILKIKLGSHSDQIYRHSIYQFIHPADLDQFISDLDLDFIHPTIHSSDERRLDKLSNLLHLETQLRSPNSSNQLDFGPTHYIKSPTVGCRLAHPAHLLRLLTTDTWSYSNESDDQYRPTDLLINPISHDRFLVFFHSTQDRPNPSHSLWTTPTPISSFSSCGITEPKPEINYFNHREAHALQTAMAHSPIISSLTHNTAPIERRSSTTTKHSPSLDIFLILDSSTGQVIFSHHSLPSGNISDYRFCPEDYACLAMQSKHQNQLDINHNETLGHSNCSRRLTGQHRLVKDSTVIDIIQAFTVEYGTVTFAGFKSSLTLSPPTHSILNQRSNVMMNNSETSPLEMVHDTRPMPLDLYSPTSSRLARSQKRPRTDSCSEVLTPQSACSTHSQIFSQSHYQRPSSHSSHQYSPFNPHHPPISSLNSNIPMPESPDPFGSQYTHFSGGELSPTMASAANVLGSFHRAHYHHPQTILALQDLRHNPISPSSSVRPSMIGYDNYGLQNLASMATTSSFDPPPPPPPPPDFSSASTASSPHPSGNESFGSAIVNQSGGHIHSNVHRSYGDSSKGVDGIKSANSIDEGTDGMMGRSSGTSDGYVQNSSVLTSSYRPMIGDSTPIPLVPQDNRTTLKRPRFGTEVNTGNNALVDGTTIRCCTSCGAQNSPEWRKGPNGVKSLCNACGLRFSRAQARKSKVPKNVSNGGNLKKVTTAMNKKKNTTGVPHNTGNTTLAEEDSRLVIEGFRG